MAPQKQAPAQKKASNSPKKNSQPQKGKPRGRKGVAFSRQRVATQNYNSEKLMSKGLSNALVQFSDPHTDTVVTLIAGQISQFVGWICRYTSSLLPASTAAQFGNEYRTFFDDIVNAMKGVTSDIEEAPDWYWRIRDSVRPKKYRGMTFRMNPADWVDGNDQVTTGNYYDPWGLYPATGHTPTGITVPTTYTVDYGSLASLFKRFDGYFKMIPREKAHRDDSDCSAYGMHLMTTTLSTTTKGYYRVGATVYYETPIPTTCHGPMKQRWLAAYPWRFTTGTNTYRTGPFRSNPSNWEAELFHHLNCERAHAPVKLCRARPVLAPFSIFDMVDVVLTFMGTIAAAQSIVYTSSVQYMAAYIYTLIFAHLAPWASVGAHSVATTETGWTVDSWTFRGGSGQAPLTDVRQYPVPFWLAINLSGLYPTLRNGVMYYPVGHTKKDANYPTALARASYTSASWAVDDITGWNSWTSGLAIGSWRDASGTAVADITTLGKFSAVRRLPSGPSELQFGDTFMCFFTPDVGQNSDSTFCSENMNTPRTNAIYSFITPGSNDLGNSVHSQEWFQVEKGMPFRRTNGVGYSGRKAEIKRFLKTATDQYLNTMFKDMINEYDDTQTKMNKQTETRSGLGADSESWYSWISPYLPSASSIGGSAIGWYGSSYLGNQAADIARGGRNHPYYGRV